MWCKSVSHETALLIVEGDPYEKIDIPESERIAQKEKVPLEEPYLIPHSLLLERFF